ncbi:unnamed protein product, partial [Echinostoma caproni]|uniref:Ovule protein n=1 Tax=Echinostoma caproni TaxID=27848 RepID=A0A183A4R5_9TREM
MCTQNLTEESSELQGLPVNEILRDLQTVPSRSVVENDDQTHVPSHAAAEADSGSENKKIDLVDPPPLIDGYVNTGSEIATTKSSKSDDMIKAKHGELADVKEPTICCGTSTGANKSMETQGVVPVIVTENQTGMPHA